MIHVWQVRETIEVDGPQTVSVSEKGRARVVRERERHRRAQANRETRSTLVPKKAVVKVAFEHVKNRAFAGCDGTPLQAKET